MFLTDFVRTNHGIGSGNFATVFRWETKSTGEPVACKQFNKKELTTQDTVSVKREIDILTTLHHKHIVQFLCTFEDVTHIMVVMEKCEGIELFDQIVSKGTFSESLTMMTMKAILQAVKFLHEKLITHRDIKPENIMVSVSDDGKTLHSCKLIDFGLAVTVSSRDAVMRGRIGTPFYIPPEVLNNRYTMLCDEWSCGVVMYILLSGYPPFYGNSEQAIFYKIRNSEPDLKHEAWTAISHQPKEVISSLLQKNPSERISVETLLLQLN